MLALFGAYYQFKPKLSLEPESPLKSDSDSIINTPFRVTNESLLPVYNVQQDWRLETHRVTSLASGEDVAYDVEKIEAQPGQPDSTIAILHSSQSATLYPFDNIRTREVTVNRLKLLVIITYQTAIFHWKRQQNFFFEGNVGADSSFHWYHTSVPER